MYLVEVFISWEYVCEEGDKIWVKVWQYVGCVEEILEVGNFIIYDVLDDFIIIVRDIFDILKVFYNVCLYWG